MFFFKFFCKCEILLCECASSAVNMVTTDVIGDTFTDIYQKTTGNYTNKAKTGICKESHTLRASYQCPRTFLWLRQGAMETMGAMETVGAMETMGTYEPRSRKAAKRFPSRPCHTLRARCAQIGFYLVFARGMFPSRSGENARFYGDCGIRH